MPDAIVNAFREATQPPRAPASGTENGGQAGQGSNGGNGAQNGAQQGSEGNGGSGGQRKSGNRFANWWFGDR